MMLILHSFFGRPVRRYFLRLFFAGNFFRLVLAKSRSCFSLIDFAICFDGPLSDAFDRFPRLAANAAPAAICCFLDLAGIILFLFCDLHLLRHLEVLFHYRDGVVDEFL